MLLHPQNTYKVLEEIKAERRRQDEKWGQQDHKDFGSQVPQPLRKATLSSCRATLDKLEAQKQPTWDLILEEECMEALVETTDVKKLRTELIQTAAVCTAWVECIDRKEAHKPQS